MEYIPELPVKTENFLATVAAKHIMMSSEIDLISYVSIIHNVPHH